MFPFAALADPTRCRIVEMLAAGDLPAGDIAARFDMTPPAVSQHLKVLRDAGLVRVRKERQKRIYAVDRAGFRDLERWLDALRESSHRGGSIEAHLGDAALRFLIGRVEAVSSHGQEDGRAQPSQRTSPQNDIAAMRTRDVPGNRQAETDSSSL